MPDRADRYVVRDAAASIDNETLEAIIDISLEHQHGRETAHGIVLMRACTAPLLQELIERRRAMERIAAVVNVRNLQPIPHRAGPPTPSAHRA